MSVQMMRSHREKTLLSTPTLGKNEDTTRLWREYAWLYVCHGSARDYKAQDA